jgi:hypothetical protein
MHLEFMCIFPTRGRETKTEMKLIGRRYCVFVRYYNCILGCIYFSVQTFIFIIIFRNNRVFPYVSIYSQCNLLLS